jgi:hypothetical protein
MVLDFFDIEITDIWQNRQVSISSIEEGDVYDIHEFVALCDELTNELRGKAVSGIDRSGNFYVAINRYPDKLVQIKFDLIFNRDNVGERDLRVALGF